MLVSVQPGEPMKVMPAPSRRNAAAHPCEQCFQSRFCLPIALPQDELACMRDIMQATVRMHKGEALFEAGQPVSKLYSVHAGSFKSVVGSPDGRQQIVGFHVAGELMGLESFAMRTFATDGVALEDSEACEIDVGTLERHAAASPALLHQIHGLIGNRLACAQQNQFALGSMHAEERLARFLLDLSQRYRARGLSPDAFVLSMTRQDIASYLGLKLETVSRLMTRLHRDGILQVEQRRVRITNRDGLTALLAPPGH
ncbi:putative transcriptional regulator,FNR-like/crp [Thiomonas delicata]|uniref:Putative transcriptional regulator,FNR-like/crp n=2 Tax=Burkholderiales genera incertae sedis TaxID=224471 RepID=A0A238D449_THIDL|nr:putative transcriptional regulator,FNR-like/crp [Thiomonas delicata]